jgi:hypothetical protein
VSSGGSCRVHDVRELHVDEKESCRDNGLRLGLYWGKGRRELLWCRKGHGSQEQDMRTGCTCIRFDE